MAQAAHKAARKQSWWRRLFSRKKDASCQPHPAEEATLAPSTPPSAARSPTDHSNDLDSLEIVIIPFVGPLKEPPTFAYYPYPGAQPKGHVGIVLKPHIARLLRIPWTLPAGVVIMPANIIDWDNEDKWLRWSMYPQRWPLQNVQRYEVVINPLAEREEDFLDEGKCRENMEDAHAAFASLLIRAGVGAKRFWRVVRL